MLLQLRQSPSTEELRLNSTRKMEHRGMSHVTSHKDTHAEAEAAKAAHVRPQDRDVPINDDDIKEGEVVHFRDHEVGRRAITALAGG